jgi:hypothetical protein
MSATVLKSAVKTIGAEGDAASITGFPSAGGVAVQIVGALSATITFEVTIDGTNWVAFSMTPSNSGTDASTATAAGAFSKPMNGYAGFRARCSAYSSGSPVVTVRYTS